MKGDPKIVQHFKRKLSRSQPSESLRTVFNPKKAPVFFFIKPWPYFFIETKGNAFFAENIGVPRIKLLLFIWQRQNAI